MHGADLRAEREGLGLSRAALRALCRAHRDSERRSWAEARRRRIESERED